MDKTIRRNEICAIGLPRCDFVFSSTRTSFIAYGFTESPLEMAIIRKLLEERSIQAVEAGGVLAPAQSAFCAKSCSKIITSQFCVVLLNDEGPKGAEVPNANVNMEYGLMLGFNKYVIPFQRETQALPFNVAGLDTIKYTDKDFEQLAASAIDQAIQETQQDALPPVPADQLLESFLLTQKAMYTPINSVGDRNIFEMGKPLGFNLLNDFSGMNYIFLGNFTHLRSEMVNWRVKLLVEIIDGRAETMDIRMEAGMATKAQADLGKKILEDSQIWLIVNSNADKEDINSVLGPTSHSINIFSIDDVKSDLEILNTPNDSAT